MQPKKKSLLQKRLCGCFNNLFTPGLMCCMIMKNLVLELELIEPELWFRLYDKSEYKLPEGFKVVFAPNMFLFFPSM